MKNLLLGALTITLPFLGMGQTIEKDTIIQSNDTTEIVVGSKEIIIINTGDDRDIEISTCEENKKPKKAHSSGHWAGVELGYTVLMNPDFGTSFDGYEYLENDPAKSPTWNLNLFQYKFNVARHIFGINTGLGFQFSSIGIKNNYVIQHTKTNPGAYMDTVNTYSKNKLNTWYMSVPVIFEFNTSADEDKAFYFGVGVIGSVRLSSKTKLIGGVDGAETKYKTKGQYGLNAFKVDGTFRMGYRNIGMFVNYDLLPLFESNIATAVHPLTFGLSLNFL